jgi:chromosome segregation ATPase
MSEHENWCDYPSGPCDCGYAIEVSKIKKPLVSQIQSLKSTVKSQDELIKKQAARIKELEDYADSLLREKEYAVEHMEEMAEENENLKEVCEEIIDEGYVDRNNYARLKQALEGR